jgi:hypothetical protein
MHIHVVRPHVTNDIFPFTFMSMFIEVNFNGCLVCLLSKVAFLSFRAELARPRTLIFLILPDFIDHRRALHLLREVNSTWPFMASPNIVFHSSCACSRVSYTSSEPPSDTSICFCTTCRKLSGWPCVMFTDVPAKRLTFTDTKTGASCEGWPDSSEGSG